MGQKNAGYGMAWKASVGYKGENKLMKFQDLQKSEAGGEVGKRKRMGAGKILEATN